MSTATITVKQRSSGLTGAIASEWTKLWTVRSTWLNLVGGAVLTVLLGIQFGFSTAYDNAHQPLGDVPGQTAVGGVGVSSVLILQVVIAAFAMLPVTSEYSTGSIRSTVQWTPVRRNVVLAKATVLAPVLFGYGLLVGLLATVSGGLAMGHWADWDAATLVVDLLSIATYLTLAGIFTAGIAFLIRSTAGTLTAAFLVLMMIPLMLAQSSIRALVWLAALLPGGAGQNFLSGSTDPLTPPLSLAVLILWALGGLWIGTKVLARRDA
ncbi:ABC transporter permease [Kribbella qitaiheensis]|uniref:ABC transporter permease n=1 Tax=Kribbella qitaiheensis TaxID=1544730 RepID=A0A7G6WTY4_9ACTN|nr:ABC transporter permease [Kribbella qitaiheensis]QNE17449.1 ABC transporter permease [Kribbella qitaiheensis]